MESVASMFELPLESEVSSVFPSKRVEVRPGVQLWISSGTMKQKLQRKASTTSSIFELAYSQEKSLYSELGRASVEIKPGYSNLGFLGQTTGYSEYNCGEEIKLYSIWVEPQRQSVEIQISDFILFKTFPVLIILSSTMRMKSVY